MDYREGNRDCEFDKIRKQLKENNIDPDKHIKNLDEALELIEKLEELGIIDKKPNIEFYPKDIRYMFSKEEYINWVIENKKEEDKTKYDPSSIRKPISLDHFAIPDEIRLWPKILKGNLLKQHKKD